MDTRFDFEFPAMHQGRSYAGDRNRNNTPERMNAGNETGSEIKVNFNVSTRRNSVHNLLGVSDVVFLEINFNYESTKNNDKIIEQMYRPRTYYTQGILSSWSIHAKFNEEIFNHFKSKNEVSTYITNERNVLNMTFELPDFHADYTLQLLSIISDAIRILKDNNVSVNFTLMTLLIKLMRNIEKITTYMKELLRYSVWLT